ncbi:10450_t:CDS:2 [Dentiscutata erythropus]|uniref:10450_t:CDS:1 n=1 Tax=Dentiscutata erythropus TaxID=1348616 RepID=A0A9N9ER20_9GLOM|nr:10450_t:CDS:2 [Dentiscutata erythropus]
MSADIKTLRETLKTLAVSDEESKNDFFSNDSCDDYSVPDSFTQIFGYAFSEEDINEAIEQLRNEKETIDGIKSETASDQNEANDKYAYSVQVWDDMKKKGHKPTSIIYSTMLGFERKNYQEALRIFEQMRQDNIPMTEIIFDRIINGLLWNNRVDEACWYLIMGDYAAAKLAYEEMLSANIRPNTQIYGCMLNVFFKLNDLQNVDQMLNEKFHHEIKHLSNAYKPLLMGYINNNDLNSVTKMLQDMWDVNLNLQIWI